MAYDDLGLEPVDAPASEDRPRTRAATLRYPEAHAATTTEMDALDARLLRIVRALDR